MTTRETNIEIEYPIRAYLPLIIFSFIVTGSLLLSFIVRTIRLFLGYESNIPEIIIAGLMAFLFLQVSLWYFRGRERIEANSNKFIFVRTNGMLTLRKTVEAREIKEITVNPRTFPNDTFLDKNRQWIKEMQGAILFWNNMGRLEFKIGNSSKSFFNGLTEKTARETIQTLNRLIPDQKQDNRKSS